MYCPYHSDAEWIRLRDHAPEDFRKAVAFERAMKVSAQARGVKGQEFLHRDCKPLDQVEFKDDTRQSDMFNEVCDAGCAL